MSEMAEPAARIGSPTAYREPEGSPSRGRSKEKPRPKDPASSDLTRIELGELDEQERHELDTIA